MKTILSRDGWELDLPRSGEFPPGAAFVARGGRRRIAFYFPVLAEPVLRRTFRQIARRDGEALRTLGVLLVPNRADLERLRASRQAPSQYPRALFACEEDLRELAAGRVPLFEPRPAEIRSFHATVLANVPIGHGGISHYLLQFRAPELHALAPPQFVMMDTYPARPLARRRLQRQGLAGMVDLDPVPYLKRPFGVYRAHYQEFPPDYLKRLALPPTLALALHLPLPDHYDLLYKVLPHGLGTRWMSRLRPGQKVHMLGPLGQPFDARLLRAAGIEEVHVIGGGVGMAPLVQLIESLRFLAFRPKVFLGIAHLDSLRFRDELAATFGERPRDALIYLDDLLALGVSPEDLHVSFDTKAPTRGVRGIPLENLARGLVTDLYHRYLACHPRRNGVLGFTCGPNLMMERVCDIAATAGVPLKVLLEKRMGCGIGVCFSCVVRVRRPDGNSEYARVCREGPLFDAKEVLWNETDSKPASESSPCAARC